MTMFVRTRIIHLWIEMELPSDCINVCYEVYSCHVACSRTPTYSQKRLDKAMSNGGEAVGGLALLSFK